jgi:type II secretory pathway component PulC
MKYNKFFYLGLFLVLIIFVSIYFKWSYREGLVNIDPSIVNSNIPNGQGLSNQNILDMLNNLNNFASNTSITKINVVGNDNNYVVPAGTPNPGSVSLNGVKIGTIGQLLQQLNFLNLLTANVKSIDISYVKK